MKMTIEKDWSEEDEKMLDDAICAVGAADYYNYDDKQEIENWLKSLKDRVQPKQEWSEEDNAMLISIENILIGRGHSFHDKEINWLKSLRLNKTWKPSGEQIEALDFAADCIVPDEFCLKRKVLKELLEQLKKLREE